MARPSNKTELLDIVRSYKRVKGVGTGHRHAHTSFVSCMPMYMSLMPLASQLSRPISLMFLFHLRCHAGMSLHLCMLMCATCEGYTDGFFHHLHSWWREQFCAGDDTDAVGIVTTEMVNTLAE